MFKEPEGYGHSPYKLWGAYAAVILVFAAVFGLGAWVAVTTGDDWLLMLLCGPVPLAGYLVYQASLRHINPVMHH